MHKILVIFGMSVGGWAGWAMGARFGIFAALVLSMVGTGVGLYLGRRIAHEYF